MGQRFSVFALMAYFSVGAEILGKLKAGLSKGITSMD